MKKRQVYLEWLLMYGLIFIVLLSCANRTELNCEKYKTGNYFFKLKPPYGGNEFLIQRNDSIQIETDKASGYYSKMKITWLSNCVYQVLVTETTFPFSDSIQRIRKTIPMTTEILGGTDDYYVYKSYRKNSAIMIDTLWVVH